MAFTDDFYQHIYASLIKHYIKVNMFIFAGEPESVVQNTKEQLIFLKDEWTIDGNFSPTECVPAL